jgi:hypothetical protein
MLEASLSTGWAPARCPVDPAGGIDGEPERVAVDLSSDAETMPKVASSQRSTIQQAKWRLFIQPTAPHTFRGYGCET